MHTLFQEVALHDKILVKRDVTINKQTGGRTYETKLVKIYIMRNKWTVVYAGS